jgi:hypothetical protein
MSLSSAGGTAGNSPEAEKPLNIEEPPFDTEGDKGLWKSTTLTGKAVPSGHAGLGGADLSGSGASDDGLSLSSRAPRRASTPPDFADSSHSISRTSMRAVKVKVPA